MARPDELVAGADFFLVYFYDDDLLVPDIKTLRYEGRTTDEDDRELWLFREPQSTEQSPSAGHDVDEPDTPLLGFDESQLFRILDFDGLLAVMNELKSVRPGKTRPKQPTITLEKVLNELGVRARVSDLIASPLLDRDEDARLTGIMNEAGLDAQTDYLADKGRARILEYRVPAEATVLAALCAEILVSGYEMRADDEVQFSNSEASAGA